MDREEAGAVALEMLLKAEGFACERRYDSIRLSDSGTIIYFEEQIEEDGSDQSATFRVHTYIPRIDRTIFDFALGIPQKDRNPFEVAAEAYISSVLPIVHALTSDHVDCMGVTSETLYSKDAETGLPLEWRLLMGPLRTFHLPIAPGDGRQFADAISDLIEPSLTKPDVYWVKCYAAKLGGSHLDADCFLNNQLLEAGKERFLEIAGSFSGDGRVLMRKQILAIVPIDIDAAIAERDERRRAQWASAIDTHVAGLDASLREPVIHGIESLVAMEGCPNSALESRLIDRGCRVEDACCLPAFVANACARLRWDGRGVDWGGRFIVVNFETGEGRIGKIDDEPLFQAAMQVIAALMKEGVAGEAIDAMLAYSPEHKAISQLEAEGEALEYLSFQSLVIQTNQAIAGDLDAATRAELGLSGQADDTPESAKPWWKFW